MMPGPEVWRSMAKADEAEFDAWIAEQFDARWQLGRERYHADNEVFQGDPLQHLTEELFDALVYLWVLKRQLAQDDGGIV